jgi:hypothetical protein
MLGLLTESFTYMFPGGRALKLIKNGVNITNSSNPLILTKNITLTMEEPISLPYSHINLLFGFLCPKTIL